MIIFATRMLGRDLNCHKPKSAIAMGYTFNGDDGAIGIGGNMTGDAVAGENEYM